MVDDVVRSKTTTIERCVQRIREEYDGDAQNLFDDLTRQDSILLNLQRACQASIDLAMYLCRQRSLGNPEYSREAFSILEETGLLSTPLARKMRRMDGFRNVAVHDYKDLDLNVVQSIIEQHLTDFLDFSGRVLRDASDGSET